MSLIILFLACPLAVLMIYIKNCKIDPDMEPMNVYHAFIPFWNCVIAYGFGAFVLFYYLGKLLCSLWKKYKIALLFTDINKALSDLNKIVTDNNYNKK